MFAKINLLVACTILLTASCKKDVTPTTTSTLPLTATLKVTVLKGYLNKGDQPTDSALSQTNVYVYNTSYDRDNNNPAAYTGETDSVGEATFYGLTQTEYYLRVSNKQFGVKDDDVNTPLNGIALAEVDY